MGRLLICLLLVHFGADQAPQTKPIEDAMVTGRVIDAGTGTPVPAAIVALQPSAGPATSVQRVLTDDEGRYFFDRLAPGMYSITTTKSGWISGSYGRKRIDGGGLPVELTEHEKKSSIDILTWKYGVISGQIVDEFQEPLVDIEVRAVRRVLVSGKRQMMFAGSARTDDRGVYRLGGLIPDEYSVFVPTTVMSGAMTFPAGGASQEWLRTMTGDGTAPMSFDFDAGVLGRNGTSFVRSPLGVSSIPPSDAAWLAVTPSFAAAFGVAGATWFTIASGQERGGVDMMLKPSVTYPISGTLTLPEGSPANLALHLLSAGLEDFPLFDVATAHADASGKFTFYGVPNGEYVIRVVRAPLAPDARLGVASTTNTTFVMSSNRDRPGSMAPLATEPLWHVTQKVSVANAPVKDVQLVMKPGPRVSGRVEFVGASARPNADAWRSATVSLEAANGYRPTSPPRGQFRDAEAFAIESVRPAEYYVRATAPSGWFVKSIMWQGHSLVDAPLALGTSDVADVVITFTDQPAMISGDVYGSDEQPALTATVLVFPVDPELWIDYGRVSPRMDAARVNHLGKFSTKPLVDGAYYMIALADETVADWQDPATLAKLAKIAKQVTVRDGETSHENLKLERIR